MKETQKYGLIFLSALLIFPAAISLVHVFWGHDHGFCTQYSDSHFHQDHPDCEIFKYHQAPIAQIEIFNYILFNPEAETLSFTPFYQFLSEYQKLSFSLRGPPETV